MVVVLTAPLISEESLKVTVLLTLYEEIEKGRVRRHVK